MRTQCREKKKNERQFEARSNKRRPKNAVRLIPITCYWETGMSDIERVTDNKGWKVDAEHLAVAA